MNEKSFLIKMDIKRFGQRERKHSKVQFPLIKEEKVSQSGIQRLIAKFPQVLTDVSNLKTIKTKPAERLPKNINMPRKQTTTQRSVHQFLLAKRRSSKRIKRRSRVEMQHSARESSPEPIPTIPVGPQPAEASTDTCTTCIPAERLPVPVPALSPLEFTEEEIKVHILRTLKTNLAPPTVYICICIYVYVCACVYYFMY